MKILWISNYPLPEISQATGRQIIVNEGWKVQIAEKIANSNDEFYIAFPDSDINSIQRGRVEKYHYIAFPVKKDLKERIRGLETEKSVIKKELENGEFDIIHIWGTEFPHSYATVVAASELEQIDKTVVSLQGIAEECYVHYYTGVEYQYIKKQSIIDVIRHKGIYLDSLEMKERGRLETELLKRARCVIGRTDFDRAYVFLVNNNMFLEKSNDHEDYLYYQNNHMLCHRSIF